MRPSASLESPSAKPRSCTTTCQSSPAAMMPASLSSSARAVKGNALSSAAMATTRVFFMRVLVRAIVLLRGLQVRVIQLIDGPEQAAGDQVQVARVANGLVVVAERGGEDLRLARVRVGPDDDVVVGVLLLGLLVGVG